MTTPKHHKANFHSAIFTLVTILTITSSACMFFSIPILAEPYSYERNNLDIIPKNISMSKPDASYAIELKQNSENAQQSIANAQALIDTALGVKLPRILETTDMYELSYVGEFYITMYAATVEQCGNSLGITASGRPCSADPTCWTVAVDPSVIPLGTYLMIDGYDGIIFRADDTGSAINGYDIDIFTESESESKSFNNQSNVKVWIVEDYNG